MANDEPVHVALPKLYGAPAYARPPAQAVATADRPFDPDSLPLESEQTEADRLLALELEAELAAGSGHAEPLGSSREGSPLLRGRPFKLEAITRRIRRETRAEGR